MANSTFTNNPWPNPIWAGPGTSADGFAGSVTAQNFTHEADATLGFTATNVCGTGTKRSGTLSLVPSLKNTISTTRSATLSFTNSVKRSLAETKSATLSFVGTHKFATAHIFSPATLTYTAARKLTASHASIASFGVTGGTNDTWDPNKIGATASLSNNNLTLNGGSASYATVLSTVAFRGGKYYFEMTLGVETSPGNDGFGFANSNMVLSDYTGEDTNSIGVFPTDLSGRAVWTNATNVHTMSVGSVGDVTCFAVDFDAKLFWIRYNSGLWNNDVSANPTTGVNGFSLTITGPYFIAASVDATGDKLTANFNTPLFVAPANFSTIDFNGFFAVTSHNQAVSIALTASRGVSTITHAISTSVSFATASIKHAIATKLATASIALSGTLVAGKSFLRSSSATLSVSASHVEAIAIGRSGSIALTASRAASSLSHTVSASVSMIATRSVSLAHTVAASFALVPTVAKTVGTAVKTTLSFVNTVSRAISGKRTATLSLVSTATQGSAKFQAVASTLAYVGSLKTTPGRAFSVAIALSATARRAITRPITTVTVAFGATLAHAVTKSVSTALAYAASRAVAVARSPVLASLSLSASLIAKKTFLISTSLAFVAASVGSIGRKLSTTLALTSSYEKSYVKAFPSSIALTASSSQFYTKVAATTLGFVASSKRSIAKFIDALVGMLASSILKHHSFTSSHMVNMVMTTSHVNNPEWNHTS